MTMTDWNRNNKTPLSSLQQITRRYKPRPDSDNNCETDNNLWSATRGRHGDDPTEPKQHYAECFSPTSGVNADDHDYILICYRLATVIRLSPIPRCRASVVKASSFQKLPVPFSVAFSHYLNCRRHAFIPAALRTTSSTELREYCSTI
jgi:hypothetical protein